MAYANIEESRAAIREHYRSNKQYYKSKARRKRAENSKFLQDLRSTLKCSRCPETDPRCIDFHHEDPSKKVMTVSKAVQNGWSIKRILSEIAKCIPICSNCHRKEHSALSFSAQDAPLRTE